MKIYLPLLAAALAFAFPRPSIAAADVPIRVQRIAAQIGKLQAEKRARIDGQKKMASTLLDAERVHRLRRASDAVETLESPLALDGTGTMLVDIPAEISPALLAAIARVG